MATTAAAAAGVQVWLATAAMQPKLYLTNSPAAVKDCVHGQPAPVYAAPVWILQAMFCQQNYIT
jgi:hypothetical protein